MALRKIFPKRLCDSFETTLSSVTKHRVITSPPLQATVPPNVSRTNFHREYLTSPGFGDNGFFRLFLNRSPARLPEFLSVPVGDKLREKLKGINIANLNIDPPPPESSSSGANSVFDNRVSISVKDARKILRASQVEKLKAKLRDIPHTSIPYPHFFGICVQVCGNEDQGADFARILDDSGNVIVLGNVVFLRPDQVAKTLEGLIFESIVHPDDPRRKELEEIEKQKKMIDDKAKAQVRCELYCGLGLLTIETLVFMRLTFWELSWDVMEPICFFVTSVHFALAYVFFIRTSTEPTFQGYFHTRYKANQQRLMKTYNLNIRRYNELCKACYPR